MYPSKKMIKQKFMFWITPKKIEEWLKNIKVFFILANARSGTMFLSLILNKSPSTHVVHEPVRSDFRSHPEAFFSEKQADKYIKKFRKKEIYLRNYKKKIECYGEVNGVLRRHCNALKKSFPNAKIIHLVRDGRDVIRSWISRDVMADWHPRAKKIYPTRSDPFKSKWKTMSQFEKVCWYWNKETQYLSQNIRETIKFEEIISNYNYFKIKLLDPLGLEISEQIWENEIKSPKNITQKYKIPHWSEWDNDKLDTFYRMCGDTMREIGYKL